MKNKSTILSTIVCLLPMVLSAVLYSKLPEQIAVHFNNSGVADNYLPKAIAAFGLPLLFAAINLYSHFRINKDPKSENASASLKSLTQWIVPVISVVLVPITLFMALDVNVPILLIVQALAGVVVVICGNYLPKCKRNYTIGIKLPWTLDSEDNWNKTHRFAGFIWVIGGIGILLNAFLNISWIIMVGIIIMLVVVPFCYSYLLYKK
ncbi:MAG: SdpI family protein [Solobacterium sp.]|nr:SdpI family protein [Solobacterium sp.]MCH4205740.1 SdpI family protein [Solobacterium sp.]MCH4227264.1 SdpI family protein [Solobacterium sp.]